MIFRPSRYRVVAMLSCADQQIGSWSLGAVVDTSNVLNLTGDIPDRGHAPAASTSPRHCRPERHLPGRRRTQG